MIRKSVLLPCSREQAFALFTSRISEWWPLERRHTQDPLSVISLSSDGRFFERDRHGGEVELGAVRVWEPPLRLLLDWYPGTDPQHPTSVEVRFESEGDATRVSVEHSATASSETLFPERVARYEVSWSLVLAALQQRARLDNGN
jgi:hypothetical protein